MSKELRFDIYDVKNAFLKCHSHPILSFICVEIPPKSREDFFRNSNNVFMMGKGGSGGGSNKSHQKQNRPQRACCWKQRARSITGQTRNVILKDQTFDKSVRLGL